MSIFLDESLNFDMKGPNFDLKSSALTKSFLASQLFLKYSHFITSQI